MGNYFDNLSSEIRRVLCSQYLTYLVDSIQILIHYGFNYRFKGYFCADSCLWLLVACTNPLRVNSQGQESCHLPGNIDATIDGPAGFGFCKV